MHAVRLRRETSRSADTPPLPTVLLTLFVRRAQSLGLAAGGAELVQLDVLDPDSIAAAMSGVTAVVCATGFTPSFNLKKDNPAQVDHKGTDNLVASATAEGSTVKKFVLVTSRANITNIDIRHTPFFRSRFSRS